MERNYVMPWVSELIPERLLVGPFPCSKEDIGYLGDTLHVSFVVNIREVTNETTRTGLNKASWYTCFFGKTKNPISDTRVPLPANVPKMNQKEQIKMYTGMASRISTLMNEHPGQAFYIHNQTGFDEEAFLAFMVWAMLDKKTVPKDLGGWLVENKYEQLVQDEHQRNALTAQIKVMVETNAITSMFRPVKRIKN
jgi:hypothetical protein